MMGEVKQIQPQQTIQMLHIKKHKDNFSQPAKFYVMQGNKFIKRFDHEEQASEWIYENSDQRFIEIED